MRELEDWTKDTFSEAERAIGYTFSDKELLKAAFTQSAYANTRNEESNERLEFLGDAVLEFVVSDFLYRSEEYREGKLTAIRQEYVAREPLEEAVKSAGFMRFLRFAGKESDLKGKIISDLFEAIVGAIYLDGGLEEAKAFIGKFLDKIDLGNYVSMLQEYVQSKGKQPPVYRETERADKTFFATVEEFGEVGSGVGTSKAKARRNAAKDLYQKLKEKNL